MSGWWAPPPAVYCACLDTAVAMSAASPAVASPSGGGRLPKTISHHGRKLSPVIQSSIPGPSIFKQMRCPLGIRVSNSMLVAVSQAVCEQAGSAQRYLGAAGLGVEAAALALSEFAVTSKRILLYTASGYARGPSLSGTIANARPNRSFVEAVISEASAENDPATLK